MGSAADERFRLEDVDEGALRELLGREHQRTTREVEPP